MKTLYIVDYSNWVYKFKYTFNLGIETSSGVNINTSVLHGFNQAIKHNKFDDIVIALDGCPIKSLELLPQYKQQREHGKSDQQFVPKKEVLQFLTKLGELYGKRVRVVASYGQEADQVIASVAYYALGKVDTSQITALSISNSEHAITSDPYIGKYVEEFSLLQLDTDYDTVVIGSTDSDIHQLRELGNVFMDSSWSGTKIDYSNDTPKAVHNMPPATIAIYKAFLGDTSDNVPAVVPTRKGAMVRELIKQYLTSESQFLLFVTACRWNLDVQPELLPLKRLIRESESWESLRRNYAVVKLRFEGIPYVLSYPTYTIDDTLNKYRIRKL